MTKFFSTLSVLYISSVSAFNAPAFLGRHITLLRSNPVDNFERAVDCANKYGLCDLDELEALAKDLEDYEGCFFESNQETCDKEVADRLDVAEVLRLQSELKLREDYLEKANLFVGDVSAEQDLRKREEYFEAVQAYMSW